MTDAHRAGHCAVTGQCVWQTEQAGDQIRLSKPLPEAMAVHLLMTDGRNARITVHEDAVGEVEAKLPEIWRRVLHASALEYAQIAARENQTDDHRAAVRRNILRVYDSVPIGVVAIRRMTEEV